MIVSKILTLQDLSTQWLDVFIFTFGDVVVVAIYKPRD